VDLEEPSKCGVSKSVLIIKYSGDSITNNQMGVASAMDV
jgi:hypothetical protein